jgi:hypothetical protein
VSAPLHVLIERFGAKQGRAVLAALHAAGFVCVPSEPTAEMIEDGWAAANEENALETWRAMVRSALVKQAEENPEL